jgi:hypothetical protein
MLATSDACTVTHASRGSNVIDHSSAGLDDDGAMTISVGEPGIRTATRPASNAFCPVLWDDPDCAPARVLVLIELVYPRLQRGNGTKWHDSSVN